jgi:type IV secretory pathway component VirB8
VSDPIFIEAGNQAEEFPNLIALKPKKGQPGFDPEIKTVDEAYAKYLISYYIKDREGFDFRSASIEEVNRKINHIRNLSSASEFRNFQNFIDKDNPKSPIRNFGINISKTIEIDSIKFARPNPKDLASMAKVYLSNIIPSEAEVRFTAIIRDGSLGDEIKTSKERYLVKINFTFDGISKDRSNGVINFAVTNYSLYKVK